LFSAGTEIKSFGGWHGISKIWMENDLEHLGNDLGIDETSSPSKPPIGSKQLSRFSIVLKQFCVQKVRRMHTENAFSKEGHGYKFSFPKIRDEINFNQTMLELLPR
jgi:hypothetical protein